MAKTPRKTPTRVLKDAEIRVRVTTEQKLILLNAANADGLELSQWLRQVALRAAGALSGR